MIGQDHCSGRLFRDIKPNPVDLYIPRFLSTVGVQELTVEDFIDVKNEDKTKGNEDSSKEQEHNDWESEANEEWLVASSLFYKQLCLTHIKDISI